MQDFEQGRVYEQGSRIAHQLGEDLAAQELQEAPEPSQPPGRSIEGQTRETYRMLRAERRKAARWSALRSFVL